MTGPGGRRTPRSAGHGDRGGISVFVIGVAVAMLACAGLVVDGGNALNARMKLADDTEQAARYGAQQVDLIALNTDGEVVLLPDAASDAARAWMGRHGYAAAASATPEQVTVSSEDRVNTIFLGIVGIDSFQISASATAVPELP